MANCPQWVLKKYSLGPNTQDLTGLTQGAIVVLALLYGNGDFAKSLLIAQKCGWDSDTNPATVGGVVGTLLGYSRIDPHWRMVLHDTYENYCVRDMPRWVTFSEIASDTVSIGTAVISANGGRITGSGEGRVFEIPQQKPVPLLRQENASTDLIDRNRRDMVSFFREKLSSVTTRWNPQWQLTMASFETSPDVISEYMGRKGVLKAVAGPRGVLLERTLTLPERQFHFLRVGVAHHPTVLCEQTGEGEIGSWRLEVLVDGKKIGEYNVSTAGGLVVWEDPQFDLTPYAAKTVRLTLRGIATSGEFYTTSNTTYWSEAEVDSMDHPEPWR